MTGIGEIEARNRGFTHLVASDALPLRGLGGDRVAGYHAVVEVIRRAQAAGLVRDDLVPEDLPVISFAIAGILETTRDDVPGAWRRHVALLLDGCRAGATATTLPAPPQPRAAPSDDPLGPPAPVALTPSAERPLPLGSRWGASA